MSLTGIATANQAVQLLRDHHFVEPACGSGVILFALLKRCADLGLSHESLSSFEGTLVDINPDALNFVRNELSLLAEKWGISLSKVNFVCNDFRGCPAPVTKRKVLFFGNPPFVTNPRGSRWKNLYGDFLEKAINDCAPGGKVHFILPLSIAFSRDYAHMRRILRSTEKSIALSSFDNIPDTLFPNGKPEHVNTNKANSQRCSIMTVFPSKKPRIVSTNMHRWRKRDRAVLLTSRPCYQDVTHYSFDHQFPRPESGALLRYLDETKLSPKFMSLTCGGESNAVNVAGVARNFIGFRESPSKGSHQIFFDNKKDQYAALLILSSDLFLDYWRSIGDGFHLTISNIMNFPLHPHLMKVVRRNTHRGRKMWNEREQYAKTKRHPKGVTISYDFTSIALKLIPDFDATHASV